MLKLREAKTLTQGHISHGNLRYMYPTPSPDGSRESKGKMPPDPGVASTSGLEKVKKSPSFLALGEG